MSAAQSPQKEVHNAEIVSQTPAQLMLANRAALETSITQALEAQVRASVQVRYQLADMRPRDLDRVRMRILADCRRPGFAQSARYAVPRGKKQNAQGKWVDNMVSGPSIRFVESAIRNMGNISTETSLILDDEQRRIARVTVTDLETNASYFRDVVVTKVVERAKAGDREVISIRNNSEGKPVYLVRATDDEITTKEAALVSKAVRTLALRLLPSDIVEEAQEVCIRTQLDKDAKDPDAERKRVFDAYASFGVTPEMLKEHLGRDVTVADLPSLRALYASLKSGDVQWKDMATKSEDDSQGKPLADKVRARKQADKPELPTPDQQETITNLFERLSEHNQLQADTLRDADLKPADKIAALREALRAAEGGPA